MSRTRLYLTRRSPATDPCQQAHALYRSLNKSQSRYAAAVEWGRPGVLPVNAALCLDQIISRRSAQPVMGTPTPALMFSTPSDSLRKRTYRAPGYHGRSRALYIPNLHPLSPHCGILTGRNVLFTHRHHKRPSTLRTLRHHRHPAIP